MIANFYLLIIVYFGWVLFRFKDFGVLLNVIKGMFGSGVSSFTDFEMNTMVLGNLFLAVAAILACTPVVAVFALMMKNGDLNSKPAKIYYSLRAIAPIAIVLLSTAILVADSYNPFLYFEF